MYKYIVTGGCSFSAGTNMFPDDDINFNLPEIPAEEQRQLRFSKLIADEFNAEDINLSEPGGSNSLTTRRIYQWLKDNKEKAKDSLVIVSLTELLRTEKYSNLIEDFTRWRHHVNYDETFKRNRLEKVANMLDITPVYNQEIENNFINFLETELKYFISIEGETLKLNKELIMFQAFVESLGADIIFFSSMLELKNYEKSQYDLEVKLDYNNLNFYKFPNECLSWREYIYSYDKKIGFARHPGPTDNKILSKLLIKFINENRL